VANFIRARKNFRVALETRKTLLQSPPRGAQRRRPAGSWASAVLAAQTDQIEVLGLFDPKLVKMCPAGDRAKD